jgi:hypothetical protein
MQRNKLIYALADASLVVNSDLDKGGTWSGAVEQLDRLKFVPVYIRSTGTRSDGLDALRSTAHRRLVNSFGASRDDTPPRSGGEPTDRPRVLDERIVDVPGPDYGKPTCLQESNVAAAVQHGRGVFPQSSPETARILTISAADHPDRARLPALDDVPQKKSTSQQPGEAILVHNRVARMQ